MNTDSSQNHQRISVSQFFSSLIITVKANFRLLLVIAFFSFLLVGLAYFILPKKYESSLHGYSEILTKNEISFLIKGLDVILDDRNYDALSLLLNLSHENAEKIKGIDVEVFKREEDQSQTFFEITITSTDTSVFMPLTQKVQNYVLNTPYVNSKERNTRSGLLYMKRKLEEELRFEEKYQQKVLDAKELGVFMPSPGNEETGLRIVEIIDKINSTNYKLSNDLAFQTLHPFYQPIKPSNKKILIHGVFFLLITFSLWGMVIFIKDNIMSV